MRTLFIQGGADTVPGIWLVPADVNWDRLDSASVLAALDVRYMQGPASSINNNLASYDGVSGRLVRDSGVNVSAITANSAKISNATHTGEVTGSTALTIADNVIDEANLKVNVPTDGHLLTADAASSGGMKWAIQSQQVPDDASAASASNVGTLRYTVVGTTPTASAKLQMVAQTGPATYAWVDVYSNGPW
jgi:hypothetical protein